MLEHLLLYTSQELVTDSCADPNDTFSNVSCLSTLQRHVVQLDTGQVYFGYSCTAESKGLCMDWMYRACCSFISMKVLNLTLRLRHMGCCAFGWLIALPVIVVCL